jgi:hypothetical protein
MHPLARFALFQKPGKFGQATRLIGFTQESPDVAGLALAGHLALPLENTLAAGILDQYLLTSPQMAEALQSNPQALIIEGGLWDTGVRLHGPFLNSAEAYQHGWKIDSMYPTTILSLEHPSEELLHGRGVNLKRLRRDSSAYHEIIQNLQDIKQEHGRCQPREANACLHCAAQERLDKALEEYRGPPIARS